MVSMTKKNARLLKDVTNEGKTRVKMEIDKNVLLEQIQVECKHFIDRIFRLTNTSGNDGHAV